MLSALQVRSAGLQLPGRRMPHEGCTPGPASGSGKRPRRPLDVAAAGSYSPKTMTIWDYASQRHFLVDSGADESVVPATAHDQTLPRSQSLIAANGTEIATFGRRDMTVSFAPGHHIIQSLSLIHI